MKLEKNLEIITKNENMTIKSWLQFSGVSKEYNFISLKSLEKIGNRQLLADNSVNSRRLKIEEINFKNLEKFHSESLKFFNF